VRQAAQLLVRSLVKPKKEIFVMTSLRHLKRLASLSELLNVRLTTSRRDLSKTADEVDEEEVQDEETLDYAIEVGCGDGRRIEEENQSGELVKAAFGSHRTVRIC
jgi:hypothetical protein